MRHSGEKKKRCFLQRQEVKSLRPRCQNKKKEGKKKKKTLYLKETSPALTLNDAAEAVRSGRQIPSSQQTTSAMELIVSISKPLSCLGETLTVGHHRSKRPESRAVSGTQS